MISIFKSGKYLLNSLVLVSLVIGSASYILAQESSDEGDEFMLDEIVVTAQRRVENLQNISISATTIQGDELNDKAVTNFTDLQFAAPNLAIMDGQYFNTVNIRGVGLADGSPAVTNGVASYVDGVFQPPIVNSNSFYDMQDVEVLRGPQGTFVGSNATGGAIFMNSRGPTMDKVDGYAMATLGDYGLYELQGAVNTPISDIFAMRFAGNYRNRDSYYTDIGPYHSEPGALDELSGRVGALLKTDKFEAELKVSASDNKSGGFAAQVLGTYESGADIYTINYNTPVYRNEKANQTTLRMDYTLPGDIILRSVSGYQDRRFWGLYDLDASAILSLSMDQYIRERVKTEELTLISPTDGKIDYVVGAYYQRNEIDVDITMDFGIPFRVWSFNDKRYEAVFGDMGYKLTEALKLHAGIRYTKYEVEQIGENIIPGAPPIDLAGDHDDDAVIGRLALDWTLESGDLVYGVISRGSKPGGFNSQTSEFEPEFVWNYEVGWKSTMLNDHLRTQADVFWMDYQDFQQQDINLETGQLGLMNVGGATIKGLELSAQALIADFGFDVAYSYTDSEMDDFEIVNRRLIPPFVQTLPSCDFVPGGIVGVTCMNYTMANAGGGPMLYSPEHTFNASVNYTFYLPGGLTLRPIIHYSYIGETWMNLLYDPAQDLMGSRSMMNARLTLAGQKWNVEAYCDNLLDKFYIFGNITGTETYGEPRRIGIRASYFF